MDRPGAKIAWPADFCHVSSPVGPPLQILSCLAIASGASPLAHPEEASFLQLSLSAASPRPPLSSLGLCLLVESGGDCLHLLQRQQGNMTFHSGPNPKRHWCWLAIKAAVPFLTFIRPHLTLSMCSRHFIVCQGDKQNPPPESRGGCLRGSSELG